MKIIPCAFQKTLAMACVFRDLGNFGKVMTFAANCCVFGRFGALSSGLADCFHPSRDYGVWWWIHVSSFITNRRKNSFGSLLKYAKFCSKVVTRMRLWSIVSNRGTHLARSFLMHKCVCKILITRSYGKK